MEKSRIATITISRLYNLGNYEHIKYEVSAEVAPTDKALDVLLQLRSIVDCLKPLKKPYRLGQYKELLTKHTEAMSEQEKEALPEVRNIVTEYEAARASRWEALKKLDDLGGSSVKVDAKQNWDDYPEDQD